MPQAEADWKLARAMDRVSRILTEYDTGPRKSGVAMFDVEDVRQVLRCAQGAPSPTPPTPSAEEAEEERDQPWWRRGDMA